MAKEALSSRQQSGESVAWVTPYRARFNRLSKPELEKTLLIFEEILEVWGVDRYLVSPHQTIVKEGEIPSIAPEDLLLQSLLDTDGKPKTVSSGDIDRIAEVAVFLATNKWQ